MTFEFFLLQLYIINHNIIEFLLVYLEIKYKALTINAYMYNLASRYLTRNNHYVCIYHLPIIGTYLFTNSILFVIKDFIPIHWNFI